MELYYKNFRIVFGFGPNIISYFRSLYSDISSCILNNGHFTDFFDKSRGVRQGDPLSPYLFILTVELLSAAIKFNPNIKGIKINDSEFLISLYADDSTLALGDDVLSQKSSTLKTTSSRCLSF